VQQNRKLATAKADRNVAAQNEDKREERAPKTAAPRAQTHPPTSKSTREGVDVAAQEV